MDDKDFLQTAVKHLPGGLILVDRDGRIRAVNRTAETMLGLNAPIPAGLELDVALSGHPKIVKTLKEACRTLEEANRQEMTTTGPDGERMVLGYGILVLKNVRGTAVGVGLTFQDITRMIPLMDSHRFLDIALRNLPGGLIFVDLKGKVRGVNQTALRLLGLTEEIEPGTDCHKALAGHPHVYKVLLSTCESLNAVNRQELITRRPGGDTVTLGYGTLILRNAQGQAVGVGMTFQDITRFIPLPLQTEFVRLINRFFTPFAVALVVTAVWLGYAEAWARTASLSIVAGLVVFNEGSVWIARRRQAWTARISDLRQAVNFISNIALVYMLGTFWGPMWLLFVLTPIATALHADWRKTAGISVASAATLLGIYFLRDLSGPVGWGQASLHAAFIVFVSLFVNAIARMVMQIKSAQGAGHRAQSTSPSQPAAHGPEPAAASSHKLAA